MKPASEIYSTYRIWKGWSADRFMSYTVAESEYFDGEFAGIRLSGARVLDIGFGNGSFLAYAQDCGAIVAGTELAEEAAREARNRGVIVFRPDLADAIASASNDYDLATAFDVFEHLPRPELLALFDRLALLLRPGAILVARFPNGQSPLGRAFQYGDATHVTVLSARMLEQVLAGRPWAVVRAGNPHAVLGRDRSPLRRLASRARIACRSGIESAVNRLYGLTITLDPNVVVRIKRV